MSVGIQSVRSYRMSVCIQSVSRYRIIIDPCAINYFFTSPFDFDHLNVRILLIFLKHKKMQIKNNENEIK